MCISTYINGGKLNLPKIFQKRLNYRFLLNYRRSLWVTPNLLGLHNPYSIVFLGFNFIIMGKSCIIYSTSLPTGMLLCSWIPLFHCSCQRSGSRNISIWWIWYSVSTSRCWHRFFRSVQWYFLGIFRNRVWVRTTDKRSAMQHCPAPCSGCRIGQCYWRVNPEVQHGPTPSPCHRIGQG